MNEPWNDYDRHKVAELLMKEFPRLSTDRLMAAIRECDHHVKRSEGWDELFKCAKEHLIKSGGTGAPFDPRH